jgi:hypothetical protein
MRVFLLLLSCLFVSISVLEFSFSYVSDTQSRKRKSQDLDEDDDHISSAAAKKKKKQQEDISDDDLEEHEDRSNDDRDEKRIEFRIDGLDDFLPRKNYEDEDSNSQNKSNKKSGDKKSDEKGNGGSSEKPIIFNLDLGGFMKKIAGEDDDDDDEDEDYYYGRRDNRGNMGNYGANYPSMGAPPQNAQFPSTGNFMPNHTQQNNIPTTLATTQTPATLPAMTSPSFTMSAINQPTTANAVNQPTVAKALNQPTAANAHLSGDSSPGTVSQTTTTISETPQNQQYQQMYGMGQNQFANFDPNGGQYQQNYGGGMQNFQQGQQNSFGMGGNNYQAMGGGNYYQAGNSSRDVIVREATEEAVRYLRKLGVIDESKLSGLTFGDTKTGICLLCQAHKVVHVIGGQDEGICSICLERAKMNQTTSAGFFGARGNAYNGGMQPGVGYAGGAQGNGYNGYGPGGDARGPMEGLGALLDGKESIGGLLGAMGGGNNANAQGPYGQNQYGNTFGAGANNPVANQMVLNANGNLVPLSSLVGTAAPYGYTRDASGRLIPATSLEAGLSSGSSAIAANAGNPGGTLGGNVPSAGATTTITTTTTTAAANQTVLNAAGQLVPLSSLPSGSFGYTKDPTTGQLTPAKTLAEAIASGQQTAATTAAATPAATAATPAAANQMVLNAAGQLVPLSSLPPGSFGYVKDPTTGQLVPAKTLAEALAAAGTVQTATGLSGIAGAVASGIGNSLGGALATGQQTSTSGSGFLSQLANAAKSTVSGTGTAVSPTTATTPTAAATTTTPATTTTSAVATPTTPAVATPTTPAAAATTTPAVAAPTTPAAATPSSQIDNTASSSSKKKKKSKKKKGSGV